MMPDYPGPWPSPLPAPSVRIGRKIEVDARIAHLARVIAQIMQALDDVRIAQGTAVDRMRAYGRDGRGDRLPRGQVGARDRHTDRTVCYRGLEHRGGTERAEGLDDARSRRCRLNSLRIRSVERVIA